jgi:hypothetical protein
MLLNFEKIDKKDYESEFEDKVKGKEIKIFFKKE